MKRNNFSHALLICLFISLLFTTCKKEIKQSEYNSSSKMLKVFDLNGDFPLAQIKRPAGGYFLVYGENVNRQKDVSVAVTDDVGNVIHKITFGGSKNEGIWSTQLDAVGNLYICGQTFSPELRMDKDAKLTSAFDGYLAKVDKNGNLLWQRGYTDTIASPKKGTQNDGFISIHLINNKLYCVGLTGNWHTSVSGAIEFDILLVTFDENGNVLKDRWLPAAYRGESSKNFTGLYAVDAIKLNNNDLIIRMDFMAYQGQGRNMDTTALLCRYNIDKDSVLWTKYYRRTSPQGDICYGGLLANGNVAFFDSYWNTINIMDVNTGNTISTTTVNNNTADVTSNQYYMLIGVSPFTINNNLYFLGYFSKGGTVANQKPFVAKLNSQGTLVYNKTFEIPLGYFYWVTQNGNNNLQLMGGINAFNTNNIKLFTLTTDEDGNVINK
ncbi:MAG: hypothetical protein Q8M15_05675 [Bacteroidota bacterium]|nr:hypothetical protein [Bacteroidota bacterium]